MRKEKWQFDAIEQLRHEESPCSDFKMPLRLERRFAHCVVSDFHSEKSTTSLSLVIFIQHDQNLVQKVHRSSIWDIRQRFRLTIRCRLPCACSTSAQSTTVPWLFLNAPNRFITISSDSPKVSVRKVGGWRFCDSSSWITTVEFLSRSFEKKF